MLKTTLFFLSVTTVCVIKPGEKVSPLAFNLTPTSVFLNKKEYQKAKELKNTYAHNALNPKDLEIFCGKNAIKFEAEKTKRTFFVKSPLTLIKERFSYVTDENKPQKAVTSPFQEKLKENLKKNPYPCFVHTKNIAHSKNK